jgi:ABC-type transport system involved in cytochrome c biogenesis permease subunit
MVGLFFTLIILIVALIAYSKYKSNFYKGIFTRIIIIGVLGLMALVIPNDYLSRVLHPNEQIDSEQGNI